MVIRNEAPAQMAIHPGSILKEELKERGISQKNFAKKIEMQPSHLNEIIKGKRSITKQVADKFEEVLGIPLPVTIDGVLKATTPDDVSPTICSINNDSGTLTAWEAVNNDKQI